MPGEQDSISLLLDISSFSPEKMATLREFRDMFEQLQKFDGKNFNPVFGDGLAKLNESILQTNKLLDLIEIKITNLNSNFTRFWADVERGAIKAQNSVRVYKKAVDDASDSTAKFKVNAGGTLTTLEGLGQGVTKLLTNLRYMAYILPGLGIAGIFNLAFQAIGELTSAFVDWQKLFESGTDRMVRQNTEFYKSLTDLGEKLEEIGKIIENVYKTTGTGFGGAGEDAIKMQDEYVQALKAQGEEQGTVLDNEKKLAQLRYERSQKGLFPGREVEYTKEIENQVNKLTEFALKIKDIQDAITARSSKFKEGGKPVASWLGGFDEEKLKNLATMYQTEYDNINATLKINQADLKEYSDARVALNNKGLEIFKFNADQERKIRFESSKSAIDINQETQKKILADDRNFHDAREAAIKQEYNNALALAEANRKKVVDNNSSTGADIATAESKAYEDRQKALIKFNADKEKNDIDFYQRTLHANTEASKDMIQQEATKNLRISQDLNNSLEERYNAYLKYLNLTQKIVDLDYNLKIQKGAKGPAAPGSLTPEEQRQAAIHSEEQKANIVANGAKIMYEIVFSSLKKQLDAVKDNIAEEEDVDKEAHIQALTLINQRFEQHKISLKKYHEERRQIEEKYEKIDLDNQIDKDERDLKQLQDYHDKTVVEEIQFQEQLLAIAKLYQKKGVATKQDVETQEGAVQGAKDADTETDKNITKAKNKLQADRLKRAKLGQTVADADAKDWKNWVDQMARAAEAINKDIQDIYDQRIAKQERMIERRKQLIDEEYGYEQDAVEKSILAQKDKQALEIQLDAQKRVYDENAQLQEYQLKLKQFNFDKKIALANASIGVAAAIIKDGLTTPKSIADAIIGAAEIAKILATEPPAFKEGTEYFKGGLARYGEAGPEEIRIPGKKPFVATKNTISYLPPATKIVPLLKDSPEFGVHRIDESWDQTRYLAKQIRNGNKEIKNVFKPTIVLDGSFLMRKKQILGN